MIVTTEVEMTVAGAKLEMGVDYTHDIGEPETKDSPAVPESVEITDLFFLNPDGKGDFSGRVLTPDQYSIVMDAAGVAIREVCFADAAERLERAGYVKRNGSWVRGRR